MNLKVIDVKKGVRYVLVNPFRKESVHRSPNFQNTGLALCGVLYKNETVEDFHFKKYGKQMVK